MPTPNETITNSPPIAADRVRSSRIQNACPDEVTSAENVDWRESEGGQQQPPDPPSCPPSFGGSVTEEQQRTHREDEKAVAVPNTSTVHNNRHERDPQSEPSPTAEHKAFPQRTPSSSSTGPRDSPHVPSLNYDFSSKRLLPSHTSSFLRPGSKFVGQQTSDRSTYEVHVELKHVDMSESFLCGYLRIKGLTEDHPTLITYFEGEMIGDKYSFQTRRPEWGSSEKNDFQHWGKFPAYRPFATKAKRTDFSYSNFAQRENIFMRWKEYFLVPDHRVRQISGASFEGFYYICFNQISGTVSGIYFHAKSEKFQKLELNHVPDKTFSCVEFR